MIKNLISTIRRSIKQAGENLTFAVKKLFSTLKLFIREPRQILSSAGKNVISTIRRTAKGLRNALDYFTSSRITTIVFNDAEIRVAEFKGPRMTKWGSKALNPASVEELLANPRNLKSDISQLMTDSGISSKKVVIGINSLYSLSRTVALPNKPTTIVNHETIEKSLKETTSLDIKELYVSWHDVTDGEDMRQVFVVGIPKDIVDKKVLALKGAGLNPQLLELSTMALSRAVQKEQAIILNIEPVDFDVIIVVNKMPQVLHTVAWQYDGLAKTDLIEQVNTTLELAIQFYNSRYPEATLNADTPVIITGQKSTDSHLMQILQSKLHHPVQPFAPNLDYPTNLPLPQYAVNVGLALKRQSKVKNVGEHDRTLTNMNLLPAIYRPWKPNAKQMGIAAGVVALLALIVFLYQVTADAGVKLAQLENRYSLINAELQRRQLEIKARVPLQSAIEGFRTITAKRVPIAEDVKLISTEANKLGVRVTSILHDGKKTEVVAKANDHIIFRNYITALEKTGRFATPIPPPEGFPFTTSGTIKLGPKPAPTTPATPATKPPATTPPASVPKK